LVLLVHVQEAGSGATFGEQGKAVALRQHQCGSGRNTGRVWSKTRQSRDIHTLIPQPRRAYVLGEASEWKEMLEEAGATDDSC
jgi:hypothetical protein